MNRVVTVRPRARLDLLEQFVYLGERDGVELAERYLKAVDETCRILADHPRSGVVQECGTRRLEGMRRFPVRGFRSHLVFYLTGEDVVDVVRVLHGARDVRSVFKKEKR